MYARRVNDKVLDFGHRGWLYEESFLFYDRQTDSLWVQATGEAVHGKYKGTRLKRLPSTMTTWSEWRHLHPQTRVLSRPKWQTTDYWHDSYETYYATGRGIKYHHGGPLHFGLAVIGKSEQKLYPFSELAKKPVLRDTVDGEPVLVIYHAASRTAVAFDPRVDGKVLDFQLAEVTPTDVLLQERGSHSKWSGLTGRWLDSQGKAKALRPRISTPFVVENWKLHYPHGAVY